MLQNVKDKVDIVENPALKNVKPMQFSSRNEPNATNTTKTHSKKDGLNYHNALSILLDVNLNSRTTNY